MPKQDNENNNGEVNRKCSETGYKNEERKPPIHPEKGMLGHLILHNEIDFKIYKFFNYINHIKFIRFILYSQVYLVLRRASQAKHCHRLQSTSQHF